MDKPTTAEMRSYLQARTRYVRSRLDQDGPCAADMWGKELTFIDTLLELLAEPVLPEGWEIRRERRDAGGQIISVWHGEVNIARTVLAKGQLNAPAVVVRAAYLAAAQAIEEEGGGNE